MRFKRMYQRNMHGYSTSLFGSLLPGGLHIYYDQKKVKEQIAEIHKKEQEYINDMNGECVVSRLTVQ